MTAKGFIGTDVMAERPKRTRAAQYVRMSTDHQRYSTENQILAIAEYAVGRGMAVVRTYADEGKSGLTLGGRGALKQLIDDVGNGGADFEVLLVYDVSRWGRFQDADEGAYYEYLCRKAGVRLVYCAEPFENDGTPAATIMKSVKRAMAGEYSRELSAKVFAGQSRVVEKGFHGGGMPGYGLRRLLLDECGEPRFQLSHGQRKNLQSDRVILVPGPPDEVEVVKLIYDLFVSGKFNERGIAAHLNALGLRATAGRVWNRLGVKAVLTSEKYIGHGIYNRTSCKLGGRMVRNPPETWVRAKGAFEPIVTPEIFAKAQAVFAKRREKRLSDTQMLALLSALRDRRGRLSRTLIDAEPNMPSAFTYFVRFGSLRRAYQLVGFRTHRDYGDIDINARLADLHTVLLAALEAAVRSVGGKIEPVSGSAVRLLNDELTVSLVIARCAKAASGKNIWRTCKYGWPSADITVVARMETGNVAVRDFYFFPRIDSRDRPKSLTDGNAPAVEVYRFTSLDAICDLARRAPFPRAA
jgi:DNA invertase Pin-like site-specific DNA recombinase